MPKPKKQPSGNYKIRVYDYTDEAGKVHMKCFTGTKAECVRFAWEMEDKKKRSKSGDLTIGETLDQYISAKEGTLSPSTMSGYRSLRRNVYGSIEDLRIKKLSSNTLQEWISSLDLNPKTIANANGLLMAALTAADPDHTYHVKLPARKKPQLYVPSDDDVGRLLEETKGTDLEVAIMLAAFGPLRQGEICALTYADIKGNCISVSKSMVRVSAGEWTVKQPKTYSSYRTVQMPDFVIERIGTGEPTERIVPLTPERVSSRFIDLMQRLDLPHFRFHDLRHYSASIMHSMGVPDKHIMRRGGWASDSVMRAVYMGVIDAEVQSQDASINNHFAEILDLKLDRIQKEAPEIKDF